MSLLKERFFNKTKGQDLADNKFKAYVKIKEEEEPMSQKKYLRVSDFSSFFICSRRAFFQKNSKKTYSQEEIIKMKKGMKTHLRFYKYLKFSKRSFFKKMIKKIIIILILNIFLLLILVTFFYFFRG